MKKKISTTQAFLILFAATVVLILHFTCPGNVLQLGDVTVFWGRMPENPPEGVSISIGSNRLPTMKFRSWYSDIDSLHHSDKGDIPYLTELIQGAKKSAQLQELTNCHWDTLYIVKPHHTLESLGMAKVFRELEEKISETPSKDGSCVLVFWSEGKIVQYASIENKTFDFKRAPNILTHDIACSNKTFALGPICINWKRTEHTYQ